MALQFCHRYLQLLLRMLLCLGVEQLQHHCLVPLPEASDPEVISGARRLADVLPCGHAGFLVENGPTGDLEHTSSMIEVTRTRADGFVLLMDTQRQFIDMDCRELKSQSSSTEEVRASEERS